jgi:WD40 repeat protein
MPLTSYAEVCSDLDRIGVGAGGVHECGAGQRPAAGHGQAQQHDRLVVRVAFSPDGRLLATASSESDRTAKEWALVWRWFHERWTCDLPGDLIATGISGLCACSLGTSNVRLLNVRELQRLSSV